MAESQEHPPKKVKAGFGPGGYLPRLWKAEPEPDLESPPDTKKKKKKDAREAAAKGKGKKGKLPIAETDDSKKGVLLEETPGLDTIEARRTARIIAGTVVTLLLLIVGFFVVRILTRGSGEDEPRDDEKVVLVDLHAQRERNETEARALVDRARELARNGKNDLALALLDRASTAYPETKAAALAREVISRPSRDVPLFSDTAKGASQASIPNPSAPPTQAAPAATLAKAPSPVPPEPTATPPGPPPAPAAAPAYPEAALAAANPTTHGPPGNMGNPNPNPNFSPNPGPSPNPPEPAPTRTLPAGYRPRSGVGIHASGWPLEIVGGRDGSMMVLVPGGTFIMGRDGGDLAEAPVHQVRVSTFYIDKHEVTNRQFEMFVKDTGERPERSRALARDGGGVSLSEDFPVVMVSASDAREYADWAGKRLPTEAQWEMAARGTDHRPYPWGPLPPDWERPRRPRQIDAVMSFPSDLSPYGAYDMAGNAMEWTKDWFDPYYYASFRGVLAEDPTGPTSRPQSLQLTVKGGSKHWLVSAREGIKYESRLPFLGFRCALPVEGPDNVFQPIVPATTSPVQPGPRRSGKKVVVPF